MYSAKSLRDFRKDNIAAIDQFVEIHRMFFAESIYRDLTFNEHKTRATIVSMLCDSDFELNVITVVDRDHGNERIVGFHEFAFESPWMDEEIALCVNFYIAPDYRRSECSQMLLDFSAAICHSRGAKFEWASSTAGFADNGCNERAYKMLLKRNRFREIGTFLVREFGK